jgi:hypothetical protein
MKRIFFILIIAVPTLFSCNKIIDLYPQSNLNTGTYYSNLEEVKAGLTGAYNGLQNSLFNEWQFTELRSDNAKQGAPGSTASNNRDLSDLDMFTPATTHQGLYNYWLATYNNIRNTNIILQKLGVVYDPATGGITFADISIPLLDSDRKQLAGEAMFIRAYHYFNLVRLFGGVFLVHEPISAATAKTMNRSSADDIYKLIEADLKTAAASMNTLTYTQIASVDRGRATGWAAKGLLGKVYLTQNRKAEALVQLNDVKDNSGYGLENTYESVFSPGNEMNKEILFAVRYKAGGLGMGSPFANTFAPLGSGANVINGDGDGLNYPTSELDTLTNGDLRKPILIGTYGTGNATKWYVTKYLSPVVLVDDAENDWPILRYADILLMIAEAQGYTQSSLDLMNLVHARSGLAPFTMANITSVEEFERALSTERRIEFAFENQRWFDLVRFNTTMTTITAEQLIREHFADEYDSHYSEYLPPTPTLQELQSNVTAQKLLLPIPQREIDTNTQLEIEQNPGY